LHFFRAGFLGYGIAWYWLLTTRQTIILFNYIQLSAAPTITKKRLVYIGLALLVVVVAVMWLL
jgi:hypothetical protein